MRLFKGLAALAASLTVAVASAQGAELKLANFMSPNHPYEKAVFGLFADKVAKATNGAVTVQLFSGGQLGPGPIEQYNRAVDGVADIVFGLPGYTANIFPKTLLTELPGVISVESGTEMLLNNLDQLSSEYRRVVLLGIWTNAPNLLFMRDKPVRSLQDIKGLKIRVPSRNAGLVVASWGAAPVSMPAPEIYNAMQTGVIDGAFIDGTTTYAFRLSEVTKYITTGMNSSISTFFLVMNRDKFNALGKEQQAALLKAGREVSLAANKVQLAGADKGLSDFGAEKGKEVVTLSSKAAADFNAASEPVLEKVVSEAEASGIKAKEFIGALRSR